MSNVLNFLSVIFMVIQFKDHRIKTTQGRVHNDLNCRMVLVLKLDSTGL